MKMKKMLAISTIVALLCITMFASLALPPAKAAPLTGHYLAYLNGYAGIGTGNVYNPGYIVGSTTDGYYAAIIGYGAGNGGNIYGQLDATAAAGSTIYVYQNGLQGSSPESVYIATSPNGPWTQVDQTKMINGNGLVTPYYNAPFAFTYVAIAGYGNTGINLQIDCVRTS